MIVGIDPSLAGTGICTGTDWWTVHSTEDGDHRLWAIHTDVVMAVTGQAPVRLAVLEDLPVHGKAAGKTGMAQGVVRLALLERRVPYALATAATLKKFATGRGNAPKPDLRMELYKRTGLDIADDNQVDAWWLWQLGCHLLHSPDAITLPRTHTDALAKVAMRA